MVRQIQQKEYQDEVLIGALAEKVYDAITSQEGLSAWWTPGTSQKPKSEASLVSPLARTTIRK